MTSTALRERFKGRVNDASTLEALAHWNFSTSKKKQGDREAQKKTLAEKALPVRWDK